MILTKWTHSLPIPLYVSHNFIVFSEGQYVG
jgi:hypothetical protein